VVLVTVASSVRHDTRAGVLHHVLDTGDAAQASLPVGRVQGLGHPWSAHDLGPQDALAAGQADRGLPAQHADHVVLAGGVALEHATGRVAAFDSAAPADDAAGGDPRNLEALQSPGVDLGGLLPQDHAQGLVGEGDQPVGDEPDDEVDRAADEALDALPYSPGSPNDLIEGRMDPTLHRVDRAPQFTPGPVKDVPDPIPQPVPGIHAVVGNLGPGPRKPSLDDVEGASDLGPAEVQDFAESTPRPVPATCHPAGEPAPQRADPASEGIEGPPDLGPGEVQNVPNSVPGPVPGVPQLVGDPIPDPRDPAPDGIEGAPDPGPGEVQNVPD